MKASRNQLFCLFLQAGEPMTRSRLRGLWNKHFEEQENFEFLSPALSELIKLEVIDEFDIEFSGVLDDASGSHSEHGDIDLFDVDGYSGLDELLHLSSGSPAFAMEHVDDLTNIAAEQGLDLALSTLTRMPIDSTAWTGFPKGFVINEQTKQQILVLIDRADEALGRSDLTNFDIGQGSAYLRSAKILLEAPEPPQEEIWSLLQKGSAIATLTSFFASIIALVMGK